MDLFSFRSALTRRTRRWVRGFCFVAPLSLLTAFAASEPSLISGDKKSYGYSWQDELKLGAETDKEITESMGLYNDPKLQAYVAAVGQRVLQQSDFNRPSAPEMYRNTPFTFRVIDSPVVNAFALPGGYVYVTRGLLAHVQNEAQLAVVLGHEIAHVAARHASQQARRSQWTQLGVIAGAILGSKVLGEKGADLAPTLLNVGGQAAELFLLRYSREAETESDTLGVNYATRAGYAAEQSASFFEALKRLSATEGRALPNWQSSHPDPGDRAQRVVAIASQVPAETRANVGAEEYLKNIEGLVMGEDPRQGFARNGTFYHPVLAFQMPVAQGWKLQNQPAAVIMSEPNDQAVMGLRLVPGSRARDAAMQFAQQSKVQIVTSGDTAVNGLPTTVIIGQATAGENPVGIWNAFIEKDGKVYSLLGYAAQAAFERFRPTFESVAAGFSPLREPNLANVQPARLKLVRADRDAPFASFVPTSLPPDITADELAIANQVALRDTVSSGRILKIPEMTSATMAQQPDSTAPYPDNRQGYPASSYPPSQPQTTYPQAGNYPAPASTYPPQTTYPQPAPTSQPPVSTPGYPPTNYPGQGYPQQPQATRTYPPQSTYPSPQTQPTFPQPPGATDPTSSGTRYPQQPGTSSSPTYPQYPQSAPPAQVPTQSGYPQFPQPPYNSPAPSPAPQTGSQAPAWPR